MMDPQSVCAMGAQPIGAPACDTIETIHTGMAGLRLLDGLGSQATDGVNALRVMDSGKRTYLLGEIRHAESLATVWISNTDLIHSFGTSLSTTKRPFLLF